jgi:tetratricopeptide (TPR) repeat protein
MEKRFYIRKVIITVSVLAIAAELFSCNHIDPRIEKGTLNLTLGDFKRARENFEAVVDERPSSYAARLGLGKAMLQELSGHPCDSMLLFDCLTQLEAARTLSQNKEVEKLLGIVWFKRATILLANRDTLSAITALSRSIALDPSASKPVNLAGILYFYRGETAKALNLFRLVTTIDSGSASGYFNAGMVHWADSNYALAFDSWYKAALRAPADKDILMWAAMAKTRLTPAPTGSVAKKVP